MLFAVGPAPVAGAGVARAAKRITLAVVATLGLLAGNAGALEPFTKAPGPSDLAAEEDRVWAESRDLSLALRRRGMVLNEEAYVERLNGLMRTLYPEFGDAIKVRIFRDIAPNAFALPNGDVYVSLGLLGRLENEAQIAMVLAHEGAHFVHRHGFQGRNQRLAVGTVMGVVGLVGGAFGTLAALGGTLGAQIALLGGVAGHGRDMEREADRVGYERYLKLGYSQSDALRAFEVLRDYAKIDETNRPASLFASHPQLEERMDFVKSAKPGTSGSAPAADPSFAGLHRGIRLQWLPQELSAGRYKATIVALESEERRSGMPPEVDYYLSEAYRLRGENNDADRAAEWLANAYKRTPEYPPVLRASGLAAMRAGSKGDARTFFNMYLERSPAASDRAFIESYLKQLSEEGKTQ